MKFLRFKNNEEIKTGCLDNDKVLELKGDILDYFNADAGKIRENIVKTHSPDDIEIINPVDASKVVCVGLNYKDHADELEMALPDHPIIFIKPSSSLIGPNEKIVNPPESEQVDYEAELGVVIGRDCRNVSAEEAEDFIFGYTIVNDITARDLQEYDSQWTRSKSYDTFCPLGPVIDNEFTPVDKKIQSFVDGEIRQDSNISNMIFSPFELVSFMSHVMTLKAGDVIATGTPPGVGPIAVGETVEIRIEGIGSLANQLYE